MYRYSRRVSANYVSDWFNDKMDREFIQQEQGMRQDISARDDRFNNLQSIQDDRARSSRRVRAASRESIGAAQGVVQPSEMNLRWDPALRATGYVIHRPW